VSTNNKRDAGPPADSSWLKLPEAAADMRISLSMLYEKIAAGEIEVVHPGPQTTRVPRWAIREYEKRLLDEARSKREPEQQAGAA
jgi:excisionase family DNA binding protein